MGWREYGGGAMRGERMVSDRIRGEEMAGVR